MKREEAIECIRGFMGQLTEGCREALMTAIPELRESEDERMRKRAIAILKQQRDYWSYDGPMDKFPPATPRKDLVNAVDVALSYLEKQEQKPISSCDIVPYIDDAIAALQDMWREEKVAFDWDDMHEMIEDVARHFYQKEPKPVEWSEEDERILTSIIERGSVQVPPYTTALREEQIEWLMNRLKSLRPKYHGTEEYKMGYEAGRESGLRDGQKYVLDNAESYGLCKPAAWLDEDEKDNISILLCMIDSMDSISLPSGTLRISGEKRRELKEFIKRPSWKLTEDQIYTLERICSNLHLRASDDAPKLDEIIEQLKQK